MPTAQKHEDLRGRLTAVLVGNAKPGSVRAHLAKGFVEFTEMTPLGAAFDADEAVRAARKHQYGAAALAGAGAAMAVFMPGPEGRAAGKAIRFVVHKADQRALAVGDWTVLNAAEKHVPEIKKALRDIGVEVEHGGLLPKGKQRLFIRGSVRQVMHAGKPAERVDQTIRALSDGELRHEAKMSRGIWKQKALKEIGRRRKEPH